MRNVKILVGVIAGVVVLGGSAAFAASQALSPRERSEAIINDAAAQLDVEPSDLSDALKQALKNQVDAAVEAGRLTEERGTALKQRIDEQETPLLFGRGLGFGHHRGTMKLEQAASYLQLGIDELRAELSSGKTLADVAGDTGKSVEGLVDVLVADAKERIAEAVAAGKLTQAQADEKLANLEEHVTAFVNGERKHGFGMRHRFGPGGFGFGRSDGSFIMPAPAGGRA